MITLSEYIEIKLGEAPTFNVPCPGCGTKLPGFAITKVDSRWRCGHCQIDDARAAAPALIVSWDDVRGVRTELLGRCDWTQLDDIDPEVRAAWCTVRAALRSVTEDHETPGLAMVALEVIRLTSFS